MSRPLAETEVDPELKEPEGRGGRSRVDHQQPKEVGLLQSGERRQGGGGGRRRAGRQTGGRGRSARGGGG